MPGSGPWCHQSMCPSRRPKCLHVHPSVYCLFSSVAFGRVIASCGSETMRRLKKSTGETIGIRFIDCQADFSSRPSATMPSHSPCWTTPAGGRQIIDVDAVQSDSVQVCKSNTYHRLLLVVVRLICVFSCMAVMFTSLAAVDASCMAAHGANNISLCR